MIKVKILANEYLKQFTYTNATKSVTNGYTKGLEGIQNSFDIGALSTL